MWRTSTNIFETSVLKAKLRMRNKLRATTLTSKVTTRYLTRPVLSYHFHNDILCRIYLSFSFLWNMEASFKDDDDKAFPWAQPVRKSYSVERPNVMRIVIESEGNSKTASLSGGPCLSKGAWWTSVICGFVPCRFFCQHLPCSDSVILDSGHAWMAPAVHSLSRAADDSSSVSGRALKPPQALLSGWASTEWLGHPAKEDFGSPCPVFW